MNRNQGKKKEGGGEENVFKTVGHRSAGIKGYHYGLRPLKVSG